jgi:hypothetical protein
MGRMIIQIVPALPSATSGVGDYALALARVMRRDFGLNTVFVVGGKAWRGPDEVDGFPVRKLAARSADNLEAVLDVGESTFGSSSVLLQLSGYGYAVRGCPFWLLQGLKQWRTKQPNSRLVTMFHELYAFGPPWKSAFWLSPAQRMVVAGIARLSDAAVTNIQQHRERLERFDPSKREKITVLAVPSNVGEPLESDDLNARSKHMIVFGLPGSRDQMYRREMPALQRACQRFGISEVHDVGASFEGIPECVGDIQIRKHGLMSVSDLSVLLSRSTAGFVHDFPRCLGKSGVFASYCAHRLMPVTSSDCLSEADGIRCGTHYYSVDGKPESELTMADAQRIADAANEWYQGHRLQGHARVFALALETS